ncbi:hypothetical protein AAG906_022785 [Vitis piasezkii]
MQGEKQGEEENRVKKTGDSSCSLLSHFWSTSRSPFSTFYIPFQSSGSQESNASNGAQFGVETKKLQPFEEDHSKVLRNQAFASDLRPWRFTNHLEWQVLGERYEPLQGASVINFVDYSLNQGAPAGHESAETPIGHESNGYLSRQAIRLFCDNKAACDIAHNPIQHDRTKHVEVDRFFIKEKLDDKIVELSNIRLEDQLANILTKVVSSQVFSKFVDKLGMCDIYAPT